MRSLLITGATGFIGGKLAEYYLSKELDVRLLVRKPEGLSASLKKSCSVVVADLVQPGTLDEAVCGVDAVINSAGKLGHWGNSYDELYEANVQGVQNLLEAASDAGVKKLVHLSAAGVTGPLGRQPADEDYPPSPETLYEKTKWQGERRALKIASEKSLDLLVVRPTFTYGPGDPHKLKLFKAVKAGRFIFVGDGLSTFHPVYIDDLVKGIDLSLRSELTLKSIIIGGPRPVTKRELVFEIAELLDVKKPGIKIPEFAGRALAISCELAAKIFRFKPPLTRSQVLALGCNWGYSIERARKELSYEPEVDISDGLRTTVSWYQEQGWL